MRALRDALIVVAVWFGGLVGAWLLFVGIVWACIAIRDTVLMPPAAVAVGLLGVLAVYRWDRA